MSRCVPSWDLEEVNTNHDCFGLEYEVAELKWENGQLAMHELTSRRVPSNYTWEKPRTAETLEAIVNQATIQPYCKTYQVAVDVDNELVPWLNHHLPTAAAGGVDASATMTSDALVPSSNNRTEVDLRSDQARQSTTSARDAGCSTRVGSCSGDPSAFVDWRVARGGGTTVEAHDWSSCRDKSVSESGSLETIDTHGGDLGGRRWTSTSTGSPENTSSGKDFSMSTSLDDSDSHPRTQEVSVIKEKKRVNEKSWISNKRRRTPAMHNQSERKRRDEINERMKTLQKLVPNSSKMAENNPPPPPSHSTSNLTLLSILSKDKLTGPNYLDWIRALRIALRYEDKEYLLDEDLPILNDGASPEAVTEYNKQFAESTKVACLMLASMSPELQKSFENIGAFELNEQLREMFQEQARQERFQVVKSLMECKQQDGAPVCAHVQKMKAYIDRLGNLSDDFPRELAIDMVLNSLSRAYKQFIVNFNMNNMDKTLMELHGMLRSVEASMGKTQSGHSTAPVLAIREGGYKKKKVSHPKGKGKAKVVPRNQGLKRKADSSDIPPISDPKEAICFYYQGKGHWKRSCPKYLEDLKMNKVKGCGTSGTKGK